MGGDFQNKQQTVKKQTQKSIIDDDIEDLEDKKETLKLNTLKLGDDGKKDNIGQDDEWF